MAVTEKIEIVVEAKNNVKKGLNDVRDDITGFNNRIKSDTAIQLSINVAKIRTELQTVRDRIKEAQKSGDLKLEIDLRADEERLKQSLTQASRELRNFARTGEKDISVLGKLFQRVGQEIEKTREELIKAGKSTKELDKISVALKENKISAEEAKKQLENINKSKFDGLLGSLKKVAGALGLAFGVQQLVNFGKESVKSFAEFEAGLARINTITRTSSDNLKTLGNDIKTISQNYGIAKEELQETAFNIASAGVELENVNELLELSSRVALGAGTDTTTAFNGIIAVIKKYGLDLSESTRIADLFFKTNELGQTTVGDLAGGLTSLTSTANLAGVSIEELFAVYSTLTGVTGNASQVTTQLNGAINALAAPTTEASAKFKQLGIEVGKNAIEQKGLAGISKEIYEATNGNLEVIRKLIPEVEAQKLVVALATTQYDKFKNSTDELTNSQGSLDNALQEVTKTTDFQLKVASQKWDNFKITVGNSLTNIFGFLYDFVLVLKNTMEIGGKTVLAGMTGIVQLFVNSTKFIVQNFKAMAENIGIAFGNIFALAVPGINAFLGGIENTINKATKLLNKLPGIDLGGVKVGRIEGIQKRDFKELGSFGDFNLTGRMFESIGEQAQGTFDILKGNSNASKKVFQDLQIESQKFGSELQNLSGEIPEAFDKANKSVAGGTKKALKTEEELLQEQIEKQKKYLEEKQKKEDEANKTKIDNLKKAAETIGEVLDEEIEQSTKSIEEYQKQIDKLKDSIDGLNEKLQELEQGRAETLGERNIKIDEELTKLRAEEIQDTERINKLLQEKRLIESNATQAELDEAKRINELSPTARFLEEFEQKKIALEEERGLKQQQIQDLEEQKLEEESILETFTDKKILLDENYAKIRAKIEEEITNKTILETDKQISKLEQLRQKAIQAAEAMRSAGLNVGISEENRPTGNTSNTNITQTYNISNEVDATSVIRDINKNIK